MPTAPADGVNSSACASAWTVATLPLSTASPAGLVQSPAPLSVPSVGSERWMVSVSVWPMSGSVSARLENGSTGSVLVVCCAGLMPAMVGGTSGLASGTVLVTVVLQRWPGVFGSMALTVVFSVPVPAVVPPLPTVRRMVIWSAGPWMPFDASVTLPSRIEPSGCTVTGSVAARSPPKATICAETRDSPALPDSGSASLIRRSCTVPCGRLTVMSKAAVWPEPIGATAWSAVEATWMVAVCTGVLAAIGPEVATLAPPSLAA